jgi:hypothetical protein
VAFLLGLPWSVYQVPQTVLVSAALLATAVLAEVLAPHELMARTGAIDLETAIPRQFAGWTVLPNLQPVTPSDPDGVVDPDGKNVPIYSQEVGRGYVNRSGNVVMLMVAYGPMQNYRLKAHRPEMCYTAAPVVVPSFVSKSVPEKLVVAPPTKSMVTAL